MGNRDDRSEGQDYLEKYVCIGGGKRHIDRAIESDF